MKRFLIWTLVALGGLVALFIIALVVIPRFVTLETYKPEIEKRVTEATGRPFRITGEMDLSLFPWVGVSIRDVHLGNAPGFTEQDFVSIETLDVKLKLLPFLSRHIEVGRFLLEGPRIVLERDKSGRGNWEGLITSHGKDLEVQSKPGGDPAKGEKAEGIPLKSLTIHDFAIKKGSLVWIDHGAAIRKTLSDLALELKVISLDQAVSLRFSARYEGKPVNVVGSVGPLGKEPGKGPLPLDLVLVAFDEMKVALKGRVTDIATQQNLDLALEVSPFSPRNLLDALGTPFPINTQDTKALTRVALRVQVQGNPKSLALSNGLLHLDESNLTFSLHVKDVSRPDLSVVLDLDEIDLDRYFPPPSEKKTSEAPKEPHRPQPTAKPADYSALRKLVLDAVVRISKLKAKGVTFQDLYLKVLGKDGLFELSPLDLKLYKGTMSVMGAFDVRKDIPKTHLTWKANGIEVGPLIKDLRKKEMLEGKFTGSADLAFSGDQPEFIKQSLTGKADLLFVDGAIIGVDLPAKAANLRETLGWGERSERGSRTVFSLFHAPLDFDHGMLSTTATTLKSPRLNLSAAGKADLVKETLDFRLEPTFLAPVKGPGAPKQQEGTTVPVLVSGTFSAPIFRLELTGVLKKRLEKEDSQGQPRERLKGLLKDLPLRH